MNRYQMLSTGSIIPEGWLKDQLQIQLNGLSGHLDKIWPDVRDSAWLGGSREGWERLPYWLDGAIPLSYLTGDSALKERVSHYIDCILDAQDEDGWLCPCEKEKRGQYDIWALFLVSKVLTVWYRCTEDDRIPGCLYRAMKNCLSHMKQYPLFAWAKARWFEAMIALKLLKDKYDEPWIDELAQLLKAQGTDYPALEDQWKTPMNHWRQETHIVNLMMALKYEAVSGDLLHTDGTDRAEEMIRILEKYNGTAVGLITGDECLSGISPIQGTEFCAAVELAYSYEWLFAADGRTEWSDRLEQIVYNAFAATMTDDMWAHQYDQMANQIECVRFPGRSLFRTNPSDAHLFGLEPCFGCCTANFSQGWPKFTENLFMKNENELVNCAIAPCTVNTRMHNIPVEVRILTEYPFRNRITYRVRTDAPVRFSLGVRIPSWAETAVMDGQIIGNRGTVMLERIWEGTAEIIIDISRTPHLQFRPNDLFSVQYGPLIFSLPIEAEWEKIEYEKDGVQRVFPYCDYQLHRKGDFGFAFASNQFEVIENPLSGVPFGEHTPPLQIMAELVPVDWGFEDGFSSVCAKAPQNREPEGPNVKKMLQPYGSTMLRMTELPLASY